MSPSSCHHPALSIAACPLALLSILLLAAVGASSAIDATRNQKDYDDGHLGYWYLEQRLEDHGLRLPSVMDRIKGSEKQLINERTMERIIAPPKLTIKELGPEFYATLPRRRFKHGREERLKFSTKAPGDVWQGSASTDLHHALVASLSKVQKRLGVWGSIGEIGVHGGLFFIGLAHLASPREQLWACDVFEQQEKNVDGSGFGNYEYFMKKLAQFGITAPVVYKGSSAELSLDFAERAGLRPFRVMSVDGGHTRQLTFNDLTVTAANLAEGGIMVLDDVTNLDGWPGVVDGMLTWLLVYPEEFAVFFVGHNKVYICRAAFHGIYYSFIAQHPFWSQYVSDNPGSNNNFFKSKESGKNHFAWGGYRYLALKTMPQEQVLQPFWRAELGLNLPENATKPVR